MRPLLSEFSFGYALTEELVAGALGGLMAAPIFPSLIQEGQAGGGYDLEMPLVGAPLFLQFKLSDCMVYRSAAEWDDFGHSYYRMHLRPQRYSEQHRMLCDLEAGGDEVYYVAPYFHTTDELNMFYAFRTVAGNSVWFNPQGIGYIADNDDHYVAFDAALPYGLFCSKERRHTDTKFSQKAVGERVRKYAKERQEPVTREFFEGISEQILALPGHENETVAYLRSREFQDRRRRDIRQEAQFAAFLSRTILEAELFVLSPQNQ